MKLFYAMYISHYYIEINKYECEEMWLQTQWLEYSQLPVLILIFTAHYEQHLKNTPLYKVLDMDSSLMIYLILKINLCHTTYVMQYYKIYNSLKIKA